MVKKILKSVLKKREKRLAKHNLKVAMDEWKLKVKERDFYTCQKCGQNLKELNDKGKERTKHPHHLIPNTKKKKEYFDLRTELMNGILLCSYCHQNGPDSAHKNPIGFTMWMQTHKPTQYLWAVSMLEMINKNGL